MDGKPLMAEAAPEPNGVAKAADAGTKRRAMATVATLRIFKYTAMMPQHGSTRAGGGVYGFASARLLLLRARLGRRRDNVFHAHIGDHIPVDLVIMGKIQDQEGHAQIAGLAAAFLGDVDHLGSRRISQRRIDAVA